MTGHTQKDGDWHDELVLLSELSGVNKQLSNYVLRILDADAGRAPELPVEQEQALGKRLAELGANLQTRARHRMTDDAASPQVIEFDDQS
ncbi:hypothetical protein EV193_101979 [Herbihabitans rhizosphaerae]|uniref:Uncharacterized protein n=1 Tax=Herbihabitans rhizosphaerae TaxID=1872711 RepID=A0A4V2EUM5_9PSEU|nr:hypothetical protein [Herbihabitans rhizosphaerae]RZS45093.1 hypothetical protein EV193_101979 [Herbihabitans rhizosphaerae]